MHLGLRLVWMVCIQLPSTIPASGDHALLTVLLLLLALSHVLLPHLLP
jgi:hypothetical protein